MDRGTTTDEQTEEEQISNRGRANFEQRKSKFQTEAEQTNRADRRLTGHTRIDVRKN